LVFAGVADSHHQKALQELVSKERIEGRVHFLGYVPDDDLASLFSVATAFVFPSLYEGFGLPVLEAMACGTPVITSNVTSLPEVARGAARLVDPLKVSQITAAMSQLVEDASERARLRRLGFMRAAEYCWEASAGRTLALYEEVIGSNGVE
jgi:glycosyltransferase involved in cell wall biosynthesis